MLRIRVQVQLIVSENESEAESSLEMNSPVVQGGVERSKRQKKQTATTTTHSKKQVLGGSTNTMGEDDKVSNTDGIAGSGIGISCMQEIAMSISGRVLVNPSPSTAVIDTQRSYPLHGWGYAFSLQHYQMPPFGG
jgi:hypothetical protein